MTISPAKRSCAVVLVAVCGLTTIRADEVMSPVATVLFVCEHGSVKSLMAATLFDQAAQKRGISIRGVSRGITPDTHIPPRIVAGLKLDGVDVAAFKPTRIDENDTRAAIRVIAIGVDPSAVPVAKSVEAWTDIPESSNYPAARAALIRHIETLLDKLQTAAAKDDKY
jgi:arsenate reductase (thioredoxin)